jgi:DNA-binding protein HU-beta
MANKLDFVQNIYDALECEITRKQAKIAFDAVIGTIEEAICNGERVILKGLGTFTPVSRAERTYNVPTKDKEKIVKPAYKTVKFKPSPLFVELINYYQE